MVDPQPWPQPLDEHGEVLALFEETLASTNQTSDELRERARELRERAAATDVPGHREAAIALADRYEQAAAARVASR
jgi:hypothetical protein